MQRKFRVFLLLVVQLFIIFNWYTAYSCHIEIIGCVSMMYINLFLAQNYSSILLCWCFFRLLMLLCCVQHHNWRAYINCFKEQDGYRHIFKNMSLPLFFSHPPLASTHVSGNSKKLNNSYTSVKLWKLNIAYFPVYNRIITSTAHASCR
jgi:hypothetical protein